ncbi:MAG TPA: rhomboid family intramembrane serine protease [Hyphomicrobiales bacterium]|nr:rhomboid family intramembrane serine protease [Hyphomicrobiales bacterium]
MLFVPLWDMNPLKRVRFQYVTVGLILLNCAVFFFFQMGLLYPIDDTLLINYSIIPNELLHFAQVPPGAEVPPATDLRGPQMLILPKEITLITYMFLHGSILHLAGNMIFLWVFGDNVEDCMGHVRFLIFYLLCGIFAGLTHALVSVPSDVPMIGASGAVAGVIAAYLMLHPYVRVWVLAFYRIPLRVSAGFALAVWILLQIANIYLDTSGNTAWWAHIGGLVAGAVLVVFLRRPGVHLFDKATGLTPSA